MQRSSHPPFWYPYHAYSYIHFSSSVQIFAAVLHVHIKLTEFAINWIIHYDGSTTNELGSEPETAIDVQDYSWFAMTSLYQSSYEIFYVQMIHIS